MTVITQDAVTETLRKVVEQKGSDYVYPLGTTGESCFYTEDGAPSCIVGWVVSKLDPEAFEALAEYESVNGESFSASEIVNYTDLNFSGEDNVVMALQAAQEIQDNGGTWGVALQAYDRVLAGEGYYTVTRELKGDLEW